MKHVRPLVFWPPFALLSAGIIFSFVDKEGFFALASAANTWVLQTFDQAFIWGALLILATSIFAALMLWGLSRAEARSQLVFFAGADLARGRARLPDSLVDCHENLNCLPWCSPGRSAAPHHRRVRGVASRRAPQPGILVGLGCWNPDRRRLCLVAQPGVWLRHR